MTKELQADDRAGNTYRISALVEASGVSRDMIKYYLRAGLLPPADKPRANLSLYSNTHLQLITLVRKFQGRTRLSLPEIAGVFQAADYDTGTIELELLSDKYRSDDGDNIIPLHSEPRDIGDLAIPADFQQQLAELALLDNPAQPDDDEQMIGGLLWAAHNAGVPLQFLQAARAQIEELADLEVKTLIRVKRPELSFNELVQNVSEVDRIINRWIAAEKSRRIRSQFQRVIDNSAKAISSLLDTLYQPSHLFHQRYCTDRVLSELRKLTDEQAGSIPSNGEERFASLLLGDYGLTMQLAKAALAADNSDIIARACIALAHGMQGQADEAFAAALPLEHSESTHPVVLQARLLALLLKAAQQGGVADTNELMKNAADLFLQLPQDLTDQHPETILLLARANIAFPDFANSRSQAINALQALLTKLDNGAPDLPVAEIARLRPILLTVYRIYTLYYLGSLHCAQGDKTAAMRCLEQVVQLDPGSNFGECAYREMGRLSH